MGLVYRARHLQLGKAFALKVISPTFALDGAARARFNEEAKLASEISHPNIVSVVDFGEDAQLGAYMVMELVEGEPLIGEHVAPLAVRHACEVLAQIADALDHIHRRGIVHGDVKADNVMLTAETSGAGRRRIARLLDFGLARRSGDRDEQLNGSPHYLAPERAVGGAPSVAADVYALGVLGYLMLTGTLPFDGSVVEILMAHIHRDVPAIAERRGEPIDAAVEQLITRALAKDPVRRHRSAAAFRAELLSAMDTLDLVRRRAPSGPIIPDDRRDAAVVAAFERSRVPQALVSLDGEIKLANGGFARLLGIDRKIEGMQVSETTLPTLVPGFARAVRAAHDSGQPCERRARVFRGNHAPALELTLWFSPLGVPGLEVHLLVRVEETEPRRRDP